MARPRRTTPQTEEPGGNVVGLDGKPIDVVVLDANKRKRITKAAKDKYLALLEEGYNGKEAAEALGLTGSKMRAEAKRDPVFGEAVVQAKKVGQPQLADRIRTIYVARALSPDGPPQLLHNLAVVHLAEFEPFRKVKLEGGLDLRAMPTIDTSLYTDEELEALHALLSRQKPQEIEP